MDKALNIVNVVIPNAYRRETRFFWFFSLFITFLLFGGFASNWISNPDVLGRISLVTGLHGAFSVAWYLLLLNQIQLSGAGRYSAHKNLGKLSLLLVIAILITGPMMALEFYQRLTDFGIFNPEDAQARIRAGGFLGGTLLQWLIFLALYILGILNISNPAHHKRFMVAAAIQLMPEGLNRFTHLLALPGYSMFVLMFLIYVTLMAYDWKIKSRIYISTLLSFGLFLVLTVAMNTGFKTQAWGDWAVGMVNSL
ncbi:hypothetical protein [Shewanella sp. KCT]|uniref:hypothetical protein n=1 Tax=Shewanella sp. KCT TaxID=2569535 RepID=UPI001182F1DB|nr:hypothetical protein [Shewanella sp. KCT]TVP13231.1 hypothetical protein AYI87_12715 [Shewanella sp. KCT]